MSIILIALVLGILVVLAGLVAVWKTKGKRKHEPDYRAFFWMGLVWMATGGALIPLYCIFSMPPYAFSFNGLFAIGVVFFIMGAANRDKWKRKRKLTQGEKRLRAIALAIGIMVLAFSFWLLFSLPR